MGQLSTLRELNRARCFVTAIVIASVCAACSDGNRSNPDSSGGAGGSAGNGDGTIGPQDLEVHPMRYVAADQSFIVLEDGAPLELWSAPQGGHVVLLAARVKGLETQYAKMTATVRIPETRVIVAQESRTVVMEPAPDDPTFMQNDHRSLSQMVHTPLCPDYGSRDIVGQPYLVEVEVLELYANDSTGNAELSLIPTCMQTAADEKAECECECAADYVLGKCGAALLEAGSTEASTFDAGTGMDAGNGG